MAPTSNIRLSGLLCSTALTLITASAALAEDDEVLSLDPIVVKQRDPIGNAADRATSIYVADAEIERAAMGDLKDLFAGIAAVSVGGAIPVAQKIFVNGVDMLNLAIQVDGVSQNNRVFHHVSANAFDPGLMKSVRVDPGVAPADAGPQALAGRVVMETIDAGDILEEGEALGGKARLSYSGNGDTAQGSLTLAGRSNGFEILGYAKRATGGNYEDGEGNEVTGTAANMTAALLKLAYESGEGHRVELSHQQLEDSALRNFRANFGPTGATVLYDTTRKVTSLRYKYLGGSAMWNPEAVIGYSESDVFAPLYEPSNGVSSTYSAKFQNTFHLSEGNTITAGIDYQEKESSYTNGGLTPDAQETSEILGLFAQARLQPSARLKLSGGLRYDWEDFTGQDFAETGAPYTASPSGASGNLSVTYSITDAFSVRAAYSNVFGGIGLEDNYLFYESWDYSALKSSRAENIVIGADYIAGAWTLGAEWFSTQIDNVRTFDGPYGDRSVTNADFESTGYNLGATYGWDSGFARFTFSHSDNKWDGNDVSSFDVLDYGTPLGSILALEVQQELPQYNLVVGGAIDAALSYDSGSQEDGLQELDSYEVVSVFAEYTPPAAQNVKIRLGVENLFDTSYADRATYGGDFAGFATLNEPGRTVSLTATMKF
ncbi:TonB-dependent receptor plug domain-containing protein [Leisingera sp. McT4-56]|uniref:TonB-dependent receptor plug domain-containing protein n=1 Tax=Leisingera sp. McT4-56 TaxID=2881255 RepID=UPI001CF8A511|nr:TonB-dependent receptor [Leisingera sp. McT4-56]MCB4456824.1 TonB-dependent receptor [Leisingera sp. McT4-56]